MLQKGNHWLEIVSISNPQTMGGSTMTLQFSLKPNLPSSNSCLHLTKQCNLMAKTTANTSFFKCLLQINFQLLPLLFSLSLFPPLLSLPSKLSYFPNSLFFSLSPFNYASLGPCAVSYKVSVDGLCQEVHPALYNVPTFCPLVWELPAA